MKVGYSTIYLYDSFMLWNMACSVSLHAYRTRTTKTTSFSVKMGVLQRLLGSLLLCSVFLCLVEGDVHYYDFVVSFHFTLTLLDEISPVDFGGWRRPISVTPSTFLVHAFMIHVLSFRQDVTSQLWQS